MRTILSTILLLMLMLPCSAEEAPYFEQRGIEIDYNQDTDLHMSHPGGVLEISPYEEAPRPRRAEVRSVILKDETSGNTRTIEAGMVVTVVDKIWTSSPNNNLTAFGAYDYYTGAQLDIGMSGYSVIDFRGDAIETRCNDMHTTVLDGGTELQACVRWQRWYMNDKYDPAFCCIFSFSVPAGYDGLVLACHKPSGDAEGYAALLENGAPGLDSLGERVNDPIFTRIK